MKDVRQYIESLYKKALSDTKEILSNTDLPGQVKKNIDTIVQQSENSKAVLAVTLTSLVYKSLHPEQDIRNHQASIPNGYAGRIFDQNYITPFLRAKSFPNMAQSGWLTRSLEHKEPFDLHYNGAISPKIVKSAFLNLLHDISTSNIDSQQAALYLIANLILQRDSKILEIARPKNLAIDTIIDVLVRHFNFSYKSRGASRLPVLAFYAIYEVLTNELKRYSGMQLMPLENHTSADSRSGRLGDIDILDIDGNPFEAVEVKFGIPINLDILERAKEKILPSTVSRYYILTTANIKKGEEEKINQIVAQVKNAHGCQIVVNGIIPSLKYYLRLLDTPSLFISKYADLLSSDESIKFEHKDAWNKIISNL